MASKKEIIMRKGNKGLTVKINLWSLNHCLDEVDAEMARLWIKGQVTNGDSGEARKFNDAGELVTILGKWNVKKIADLKAAVKTQNSTKPSD